MRISRRFQAAASNPPQSVLPIDVAQPAAADGAWCECGGSDGTLPSRGRSSSSQWLILMLQPLMIYLEITEPWECWARLITKPKSEGGDEGEVGSDIYHFLPPQCLSVPLSTYKIYRLCVCVCESIHRGPQEANSQIDIRGDFQKNTFFRC